MRCSNCNVEVACKTNKCPLCGRALVSDGEQSYPTPKIRHSIRSKGSLIALIAVLIVSIVTLCVNLVLDKTFLWSIAVSAICFYIYLTVFYTIFTQNGLHKRILGQIILLSVLLFVFKLVLIKDDLINSIIISAVLFVGTVSSIIFLISTGKKAPKYVSTVLLSAVICIVINLSFAFGFNYDVKIPCYIVTGINGLLVIVLLAVFNKNLFFELKKVFHQ